MNKRTRWLLGGLAVGAGAISAAFAYRKKNHVQLDKKGDVWARPGMPVTFRAELMPGRDRTQRTFLLKELLTSGRVSLQDADGEHTETEFEPIQFDRPAS
jgi:coproporphyrinogen III oxidase-like Fe-S oxidoreductase